MPRPFSLRDAALSAALAKPTRANENTPQPDSGSGLRGAWVNVGGQGRLARFS